VFELMVRDAHQGAFDVLVVWALDRFGRSMVGNLQAVLDLDRQYPGEPFMRRCERSRSRTADALSTCSCGTRLG
jgi:hypothetical protein